MGHYCEALLLLLILGVLKMLNFLHNMNEAGGGIIKQIGLN